VNENQLFGVDCPGTKRAAGGGGYITTDTAANGNGSVPIESDTTGTGADVAEDGDIPTGWAIRFRSGSAPYGAGEIHVFAVCVNP
jgi:hypothetical protein